MRIDLQRMIIVVCCVYLGIALMSGCTPVNITRLPAREAINPQTLPELAPNHSRVYAFLGYGYMNNELGSKEDRWVGVDVNVYIDDKRVSYINEDLIVIDLPKGTYNIRWELQDLPGKELHKSIPYELSVGSGDTIYLEANSRDTKEFGMRSAILGVLGGPIGGAIAGMELESGIRFIDVFEEEPVKGPELISNMRIVDYHDLSSL